LRDSFLLWLLLSLGFFVALLDIWVIREETIMMHVLFEELLISFVQLLFLCQFKDNRQVNGIFFWSLGYLSLAFYGMAVMGCVATFLLCLGLLDDLGHDIRNTIRPKSR
jgi:hypothetical protein